MTIPRVLRTAAATLALTAGLATGTATATAARLEPATPIVGSSGSADSADGARGSSVIDLPALLGDISRGCTPGTVCRVVAASTQVVSTPIARSPIGSGSASGSDEPGSILCRLVHPSPTCQI